MQRKMKAPQSLRSKLGQRGIDGLPIYNIKKTTEKSPNPGLPSLTVDVNRPLCNDPTEEWCTRYRNPRGDETLRRDFFNQARKIALEGNRTRYLEVLLEILNHQVRGPFAIEFRIQEVRRLDRLCAHVDFGRFSPKQFSQKRAEKLDV